MSHEANKTSEPYNIHHRLLTGTRIEKLSHVACLYDCAECRSRVTTEGKVSDGKIPGNYKAISVALVVGKLLQNLNRYRM